MGERQDAEGGARKRDPGCVLSADLPPNALLVR